MRVFAIWNIKNRKYIEVYISGKIGEKELSDSIRQEFAKEERLLMANSKAMEHFYLAGVDALLQKQIEKNRRLMRAGMIEFDEYEEIE